MKKTFGSWEYDQAADTITFLPNGYELHRENGRTAEFWLRHLRPKNWYLPHLGYVVCGVDADMDLVRAMKFAGWL